MDKFSFQRRAPWIAEFLALFFLSSLVALGQGPLFPGFVPNSGDFPPAIRFVRYAMGPAGNFLYVTRDSMVLANSVRIQVTGADPNVQPVGDSAVVGYNSYVGKDPSHWTTNGHVFGAVKLNNAYPGVSAAFSTLRQPTITSQLGMGEVLFTIAPGADPSPIQLGVLNTGAAPMPGPGGIWFVGGRIPGVFIVSAQATQTSGVNTSTVTCNWLINPSGTLAIQLPDRNPALETDVAVTFEDYDFEIAHAQPAYWASSVQYPPSFGSDGSIPNANCITACSKAVLMKLDSQGNPLWVTVFGGSSNNDDAEFATAIGSGIAVSGVTASLDFPVTAAAPYPAPGSASDAYLAYFDASSGQLLQSTYAGLQGTVRVIAQQVANSSGAVAVGGGYSGSAGSDGFILLWQPLEMRFLYRFLATDAISNMAFDAASNLYFTTYQDTTPAAIGVGKLDGSGNLDGSVVAVALPAHTFGAAVQLQPAAGSSLWLVYQTVSPQGASQIWAAHVSPHTAQVLANIRVVSSGVAQNAGLTPAGNLKILVSGTPPTEAVTADAPLVAACPSSWYFAVFSPAGQLVYGTYVPGAMFGATSIFDFAAQNESTGPPPPVVSCFAATAGRMPSTVASPGELITITGGGYGPLSAVYPTPDAGGKYPLSAAGFSVKIGGIDAPIVAVARGLIAVQVPFETAALPPSGKPAIEVFQQGESLGAIPTTIVAYAFNLFDTGDRNNDLNLPALAAINQDGTINSANNPAADGSIVSLFGSGGGVLSPALPTGGLNPVPPNGPLSMTSLGSKCPACDVLYVGSAPGLSTSIMQVNVRVHWNGVSPGGVQAEGFGLALAAPAILYEIPVPATGVIFVR